MVRLFAHRGFVKNNIAQNSIKSLNSAYSNNFKAIEFDIWFVEGKLFLKHDKPKKSELKNLPQLHQYFSFGNHFDYWLDFKNLDEKNSDYVLNLVREIILNSDLELKKIYFAPFITDYKLSQKILLKIRKCFGSEVNLVAVCEELKNFDEIKLLQEFIKKNEINFISINHHLLDKTLLKIFPKIEFFAWTVNDLESMAKLEELGIKNFATDKITPLIYDKKFKPKRT